jgi:Arc/MetJ family transcription regulator
MKAHYDFSGGKRGPVLTAAPGKTRITIRIDDDLLQWFRKQVHAAGGGSYQTLINAALRQYVGSKREPLEATLRRVLREEFPRGVEGGVRKAREPVLIGNAQRRRGEGIHHDLVRAIGDKCLVAFVYKSGRPRIVEPHDYGVRRGVECLLGFQIGGESQSKALRGWKQFDVTQIQQLRVLERRFPGTRADSAQHHRTWDTLFARVA